MDIQTEILIGDAARNFDELPSLCLGVFPDLPPEYLTSRLPHIVDPSLMLARDENGRPIGFKLGYRRGRSVFYSWLGGIHPDARGNRIASVLTALQHQWAAKEGYQHVETRTRSNNNPMIIVNLKSGFEIVGFENDSSGFRVLTQRKHLGSTAPS